MHLKVVHLDDLVVDEVDVHGVSEGIAVYHEPVLGRADDGVLTEALMEIDTAIHGVCACYKHKRPVALHCDLGIRLFAEVFIGNPF